MSADSFDYRMVKCSRCGTANAFEMGTCRACGQELKKSNTANFLLLGLGGAIFIIASLSGLIYLTRGTELGAVLVLIVLGISVIFAIIGNIWLIINAFRVSAMWGLACFFIPLAQLFFLFKHTDRAAVPFAISFLSSILLMITSFALR